MNAPLSIKNAPSLAQVTFSSSGDTVHILFEGDWSIGAVLPSMTEVQRKIFSKPGITKYICFDDSRVTSRDSSLVAFIYGISLEGKRSNATSDYSKLSEGTKRLIELAHAVAPHAHAAEGERPPFLARVGLVSIQVWEGVVAVLPFIGENTITVGRFCLGRARVRRRDILEILQDCGPAALPIVTLISLLVGLILAFIGAVQLRQFGAQLYVANLVGIAMAREMAPIMVGVIMAGRTGAAFAAQLGTMQVNEEIDALQTLGISPQEFLVLPRIISLVVMVPLLSLYGLVAGILGGNIVGSSVFNITVTQYVHQTLTAVALNDVLFGFVKSIFFGVLVALCGCYQGIKCGRSASSVGHAATSAVVSGIVCIVVADAIMAVVSNIIGV